MGQLDRSLERSAVTVGLTIWRSRLIFMFVSGSVFALIVVGSLAIQPAYEGATLLIGGQVSLEQLPDGLRRQAQTSASLSRIAESDEVVSQAIDKVGLAALVPDQRPVSQSLFARLRQWIFPSSGAPTIDHSAAEIYLPRIKQSLSVRAEPNSDVIRIAFRHPDAYVAAAFANAMAETFVDRQIELQGRPGAAAFFMAQRQRFEDEVRRSSDQLKAFSVRTGIYQAADQRQLLLRRLDDQAAALALTHGTISEKIGQRQVLSDQLRRLAPVTHSPLTSSLVDALGSDHGNAAPHADDTHVTGDPMLTTVYEDSLVALFKTNSELAGAQNLQKLQQDEVSSLKAALNGLSENEQTFSSLRRALDQATYNSDVYSKRMVDEQINEESSAAKFSSVKVLERATVPLRPVFPNYPLVTAAAACVAAAVGLSAAFLSGARRRRQYVRRDIHALSLNDGVPPVRPLEQDAQRYQGHDPRRIGPIQ